jgi:hypothetical protein
LAPVDDSNEAKLERHDLALQHGQRVGAPAHQCLVTNFVLACWVSSSIAMPGMFSALVRSIHSPLPLLTIVNSPTLILSMTVIRREYISRKRHMYTLNASSFPDNQIYAFHTSSRSRSKDTNRKSAEGFS